MEPREFYFVRRTDTRQFYRAPDASTAMDAFYSDDVLDVSRYGDRQSAESAARDLSRFNNDLAKPGTLEIVQIRITIDELQASLLPFVTHRRAE